MTRRILALLAIGAGPALAGYAYQYTDQLASDPGNWDGVNHGVLSFTANGLITTDQSGGSLIYRSAITNLPNNYEVKATLTLTQSAGVFISYLRASTDARSGPGLQGTFYSAEIQNPNFNGASCSATLIIVKYVNATLSIPVQTVVPCHNGMVIRSVYTANNGINVYLDNVWYAQWIDSTPIPSGQPGIGVRGTWGSNYVKSVAFGPLDTIAPNQISSSSMATSSFATPPSTAETDLQWQPPADDANGTGVALYGITRNGAWVDYFQVPEFSNQGLATNTAYTYNVYAIDYHWNVSATLFTVTTPGPNDIDFRRIGVKPGASDDRRRRMAHLVIR